MNKRILTQLTLAVLVLTFTLAPALLRAATTTTPTAAPELTQAQLVAQITRLGGIVKTEGDAPKDPLDILNSDAWVAKKVGDVPSGAIVGITFNYTHTKFTSPAGTTVPPYDVTDEMVEQFSRLPHLIHLDLSMCEKVTDAGVKHLKGMTQLQYLSLADTKVTDAGMADLAALTQLQWLSFVTTSVGGADGMQYLAGMKHLKHLELGESRATDAGLVYIKGMTELERLNVWGSRVTDAGLDNLKGLTNLKSVSFPSGVSNEAMKQLKQSLPNCQMGN